ncbi:MAG: hypothetical protein JXB26_05575 [Candidatus Aminicenantes bacterium]|nr:hypothetical protein [Candidatus Aminicenantes bacterium]
MSCEGFEWMMVMMIDSLKAFKIALEDPELSYFMKCRFALPEKNPRIFTRKWFSKGKKGWVWKVSVEEHMSFPFKENTINAALICIDPIRGTIVSRRFFSSVLYEEYWKVAGEEYQSFR